MAAPLFSPENIPSDEFGPNASAPHLATIETPTPLQDYGLEIKDWIELSVKDRITAGVGRMVTSLVILSDGSRNIVRELYAEHQRYDLPFGTGTPLGTCVQGFNTYTAIQANKLGMNAMIVGAPQKYPTEPLQSHEAQVFATIVDASRPKILQDTSSMVLGGYSWAAMRAPAAAHYLEEKGITVPIAITKDPCLAEKTGLSETIHDMTPLYIARELVDAGKAVAGTGTGDSLQRKYHRARHLLGTVGLSRQYLTTHAEVAVELWKGEAGTFPVHMPKNTIHVVHFNEGSRFNDHDQYQAAIKRHPLGRVVMEKGLHLTPAHPNILKGYIGQFAYAQDMLDFNMTRAEIADELSVSFTNRIIY